MPVRMRRRRRVAAQCGGSALGGSARSFAVEVSSTHRIDCSEDEVDEPGLHRCAVVASSYGADAPIGVLGVIGPSRMDFGRVIPMVDFLSHAISEKLSA